MMMLCRCYEDGVRADEELYPALNEESNPVVKYKKVSAPRLSSHIQQML